MALQLLTQTDLVILDTNADAKARLTEAPFLAETTNTAANARLTLNAFIAESINANAKARATEIVFIAIHNRPAPLEPVCDLYMGDTIANYPDGIGTAGPNIDTLVRQPLQFKSEITINEDGGANSNLTPCGILRWELEYVGMSDADLTTIRTHYNLAKGRRNNFSFYDRQTAVTHTLVKYESLQVPKGERSWSRRFRVVLIKFSGVS